VGIMSYILFFYDSEVSKSHQGRLHACHREHAKNAFFLKKIGLDAAISCLSIRNFLPSVHFLNLNPRDFKIRSTEVTEPS
jgi:hypothetical protein